MRVVQRVGRLLDHASDESKLQLARFLAELAQERQQRDALEILHHDVQLTVGLAKLVHLADVRVREPAGEPRLGDEHLAEARVIREVREDPLDDDELLEARGTFEARQKDLTHAARREPREQLVPA